MKPETEENRKPIIYVKSNHPGEMADSKTFTKRPDFRAADLLKCPEQKPLKFPHDYENARSRDILRHS